MNNALRGAALVSLTAAILTSGCAAKQQVAAPPPVPAPVSAPAPAPVRSTRIVLLPDDDSGTTGRAIVSNAHGRIELSTPWASVRVSKDEGPPAPVPVSGDDRALLERLRATLPPPPVHFTLYFPTQSDEAVPESRELIKQVRQAAALHPVPEIVLVGHTDTTGPSARNLQLGRRRASAVRALLVAARVDASTIEVLSHGEATLRIPTKDEVSERRNRRVEVTVR